MVGDNGGGVDGEFMYRSVSFGGNIEGSTCVPHAATLREHTNTGTIWGLRTS